MIGLAIYWDVHDGFVSVTGGAKRWLSTFLFSLEAFGYTELFVIGNPNIVHGYNIQHQEYPDIEDVFNEYPNADIVACVGSVPENITAIPLNEFNHPEGDTIYVIGGDYGDIEFDKLPEERTSYIHIESATDMKNFWSMVVAGIVLRDRYVKDL